MTPRLLWFGVVRVVQVPSMLVKCTDRTSAHSENNKDFIFSFVKLLSLLHGRRPCSCIYLKTEDLSSRKWTCPHWVVGSFRSRV